MRPELVLRDIRRKTPHRLALESHDGPRIIAALESLTKRSQSALHVVVGVLLVPPPITVCGRQSETVVF